jgi:hypothetical protein
MKTMKLTDHEIELIEKYRNGYRGIYWHIIDFEQQATQNEEYAEENGKILKYNREDFEYALDLMIDNHDANYGITWNTISDYLNTYCKIDDNE